jgi:hypothetical protein
MKPGIKRIGRIALWGFAGLGVIYAVIFIAIWIYQDSPLGPGCSITKYAELTPGSPQYKAAELVRKRALERFPQLDFSKREVKIAIYEWEKDSPVWTVTYDEPDPTTIFGCERYRTDDYNISGQVRKRDLKLQGDVEIVSEPWGQR